MTLDRNQGTDEQGRNFGYVHGNDGGYFFTHMDTLEATIASLDVDEVDGDGGLEIAEVEEFLRDELTVKPLASFRN